MNLAELEITGSYEQVSEADIVQLEKDLEVSLPFDYRNFLLSYNGGTLKPYYLFPVHNNPRDSKAILTRFYSVTTHQDRYDDLRSRALEAGERFPSELLPIAYDPGGNHLGIIVKGSEIGKIYFWDLDDEPIDEELLSYDKLYFVANSFSELLESLQFWSGEESEL